MVFPYKLIDLTHTIGAATPTWDGGCGFNYNILSDYRDSEQDVKFRVMEMQMYAGIGTHIDAPSHCIPGGLYVHELILQDLCMPCIIIDISTKAYENYSLSCNDIIDFESTYGLINKGSCAIIRTGWEKFWDSPEKYRNNYIFPSVSIDAANLLLERGVTALGIDTLSPDRPEDEFKVHQAFLEKGNILIENVANLSGMPQTGSYIMILPIKIKDATEAPIRLIGLILMETDTEILCTEQTKIIEGK